MIPNKKIYLSIIIFGILSILLIVFIIRPLFGEIRIASQNFSLGKNKIVYLSEERENLQNIGKSYKTYQPDLDRIENLFVNPTIPIEFINFLEKTATDSQVKLEISSMTKNIEKKDTWPSLSLQLSVRGSFFNLSKFLDKLENTNYLIEAFNLSTRKLTKNEPESKELKDIPNADTETVLSIKVFTK